MTVKSPAAAGGTMVQRLKRVVIIIWYIQYSLSNLNKWQSCKSIVFLISQSVVINPKSRYIELRYSLLLVLRPAPSWKQNVAYIVPCHRWESRSIWLTNILRAACWRHSTTYERDCRPIPWCKKMLSVVGQIHTHVIMEGIIVAIPIAQFLPCCFSGYFLRTRDVDP